MELSPSGGTLDVALTSSTAQGKFYKKITLNCDGKGNLP
jgi:hypothetical protein